MKILVLGASSYQCELIQIAVRFGEVHAVSNKRSEVGFAYADNKEVISIVDFDGCLKFALKESFSAVISSGSQLAAYTQARLNDELNLNGFPFDFVRVMTDKLLMRDWFRDKGLSKIKYSSDEGFLQSSSNWIVKPRIASGSKGVERYSKNTNLEAVGKKSSFIRGWLAEEFIEGVSGSALFVIQNGKAIRLLSTNKVTNSNFVPVAHVLAELTADQIVFLQGLVEEMVEDFNLESGFVDLDFIFSGDRMEVVDVGTRLSGNGLVELYNELSGENLCEQQIKMSLNLPLSELPLLTDENIGVMLFYSIEKGTLKAYKNEFEKLEVISQKKFVNVGAKVSELTEGKNQLGFFIFKTEKSAYEEASNIAKNSTIVLE